MPRPLRICQPNLTYHVLSRCIEWRGMMEEECFKELFIEVLRITYVKYTFKINFYTVMDNHFHLVIRTCNDGESISRIMQYIKARFAERYNKITGRIGPFWNERFKDIITENQKKPEEYFLRLIWYLAYNPVRKQIVTDPRKYRYCPLNAYLEGKKQRGGIIDIEVHEYYINISRFFSIRLKRFLQYEKHYKKKLHNSVKQKNE